MIKKKESLNIFDFSGKSKKPLTKKVEAQPIPASEKSDKRKEAPLTDLEVATMLQHLKSMEEDLSSKLEVAYAKAKLTKAEIRKVVEGLETEEVEKLEKETLELERRVWEALGNEAKVFHEQKRERKATKVRKAKVGGSRRGWISTR